MMVRAVVSHEEERREEKRREGGNGKGFVQFDVRGGEEKSEITGVAVSE
jgi:hypothetical protein